VAEDPVQLSKHGKSAVASAIHPVPSWTDSSSENLICSTPSSKSTSPGDLQMVTAKTANDDKGVYMTLSCLSSHGSTSVRKHPAQRRKKLQDHLNRLRESSELTLHRLSSPESTLAARYLDILGPRSLKDQPFVMLGSWIETIPSRIGSSPVVDLALEYFADSFAVFRGDTFSTRSVALTSKSKALKQLQLVVSDDHTRATYDTVLAMKIHFVAEVGIFCRSVSTLPNLLQIFMGLKTLYHIIHAVAVIEILRHGPVAGIDVDHYWNLIDQTYVDDVSQ